MAAESYTVEPIAHVVGGRTEPTDQKVSLNEALRELDSGPG